MIILVDTRESKPWSFPSVRPRALKAGDYTVLGRTRLVGVERKGGNDWAACNYSKEARQRLEGQMMRLEKHYKHPLLVVVEPPPQFILWKMFPGIQREYLFTEFLKWTERLPAVWTPSEASGAEWAMRWFELHV